MSPTLLLLLAPSVMAAEFTVGASGDYATIGEAVAAAGYSDTITVQSGTYPETIWLAGGPTIQAEHGLGSVIIDGSGATSNVVSISNGTVRGMIIANAPGQAVQLSGSNGTLEQCAVLAPGTVGVAVISGSPVIREVAVHDAGTVAFSFVDGTPTVQRALAIDPAQAGFAVATTGSYANLIAIGASPGFEVSASGASLEHIAALDSGNFGLVATSELSVVNALFTANPQVANCRSEAVDLSYSLLHDSTDSTDCPTLGFHDNLLSPPELSAWHSGLRPPQVDFSLIDGSAMMDAGSGSDIDGSTADIGPMGGLAGAWTDGDGDGVPIHFDCDDANPDANLHAREFTDGVDNDCDGEIDETEPVDDTGVETDTPVDTGEPPDEAPDIDGDGYTVLTGDCQDHNSATWPGADELADGADNDCDGVIDEGTWYFDDDGDGYAETEGDCDDGDPTRSPAEPEQGEDGIDHDCDGTADGATTADADDDGFTVGDGDCDDSRPGVNPEAFDGIDGIDGDCDGVTDDDGLVRDADDDGVTIGEMDCDDGDISISSTSPERADDGIDQDCDGVDLYDVDQDGHASPDAGGADCDDSLATIYPGATETCDGLDNDCDNDIDEFCMDSEIDGPERDPWDPGIHGACNCTTQGGQRSGLAWLLLAGCGLVAIRRRPRTLNA